MESVEILNKLLSEHQGEFISKILIIYSLTNLYNLKSFVDRQDILDLLFKSKSVVSLWPTTYNVDQLILEFDK